MNNSILQKIVDGEYKIEQDVMVAADGGTVAFTVGNDAGERHVLFLDRRLMTDSKDVFYQGAYPGQTGSVQLGKNDALVAIVEANFKNSDG